MIRVGSHQWGVGSVALLEFESANFTHANPDVLRENRFRFGRSYSNGHEFTVNFCYPTLSFTFLIDPISDGGKVVALKLWIMTQIWPYRVVKHLFAIYLRGTERRFPPLLWRAIELTQQSESRRQNASPR